MKKYLLALALTLGFSAAAMATDLSAVGSTGVEATVDYRYDRSLETPYFLGVHQGLAGLQFNLGTLGSFTAEAGDTQTVTSFRNNYTTFAVGYANGFSVGKLKLVGDVTYEDATGDTWLPVIHGKNSSTPATFAVATVEASFPLSSSLRVFSDYEHIVSWKNPADNTSVNADGVTGGVYLDLSSKLTLKLGGGRDYTALTNFWTVQTSLSYKL